jgi:hypothetical protein
MKKMRSHADGPTVYALPLISDYILNLVKLPNKNVVLWVTHNVTQVNSAPSLQFHKLAAHVIATQIIAWTATNRRSDKPRTTSCLLRSYR